jgi:hypothetical protein
VQRLKKPFSVNQIVRAELSYRPLIIAGNYYRVVKVNRAPSFSRWMIGVAGLENSSALLETLDAGYFSKINGNSTENYPLVLEKKKRRLLTCH